MKYDGDQHIGGDGAPYLGLHGVFGGGKKPFDPEVLFDPLEEQFDLPAALVEGGDRQGRQSGVVGEEEQCLARVGILEANAAQLLGVFST